MSAKGIPSTPTDWWNCAALVVGATAGYIVHPSIWIIGPFRWWALLLGQAAQESGYNPDAGNYLDPNGGSFGMLQFNKPVWESLTGRPLADASRPSLQGFYAAKYVALAFETDRRWYWVLAPFYGFAVIRWMWGGGYGSSRADTLDQAWSHVTEDTPRAWAAFAFWRGLTLLPALLLAPVLLWPWWRKR